MQQAVCSQRLLESTLPRSLFHPTEMERISKGQNQADVERFWKSPCSYTLTGLRRHFPAHSVICIRCVSFWTKKKSSLFLFLIFDLPIPFTRSGFTIGYSFQISNWFRAFMYAFWVSALMKSQHYWFKRIHQVLLKVIALLKSTLNWTKIIKPRTRW